MRETRSVVEFSSSFVNGKGPRDTQTINTRAALSYVLCAICALMKGAETEKVTIFNCGVNE
jgi:hypothetical protein